MAGSKAPSTKDRMMVEPSCAPLDQEMLGRVSCQSSVTSGYKLPELGKIQSQIQVAYHIYDNQLPDNNLNRATFVSPNTADLSSGGQTYRV